VLSCYSKANCTTQNRLTQRALDAGDCRSAACGTNGKHFAKCGFEFSLFPNRFHARPSASNDNR